MTAENRYTPPRAEVDDIHVVSDETQEVTVWSARGRIGRLRYVAYNMAAALISAAVSGVLAGIVGPRAAMVVTMLFYIPITVLGVLTLIQRTHDMGWSGWRSLFVLIPFVAFVWVFKAGTPGGNRYGAPPPPNPTSVKVLGLWVPAGLTVLMFVGVILAVTLGSRASKGGF
jgi:uncharacterized membrane protein YhaH (DUF805 family)